MSWNHRIIKSKWTLKDMKGESFSIHEVYYDEKNNPISWTENPIYLSAEHPQEIMDELIHIKTAFKRPILEEVEGKLVEVDSPQTNN